MEHLLGTPEARQKQFKKCRDDTGDNIHRYPGYIPVTAHHSMLTNTTHIRLYIRPELFLLRVELRHILMEKNKITIKMFVFQYKMIGD